MLKIEKTICNRKNSTFWDTKNCEIVQPQLFIHQYIIIDVNFKILLIMLVNILRFIIIDLGFNFNLLTSFVLLTDV